MTPSRGKTTYLVDLTETLECTYCYKKYLAKNLICQQGRFFKADILFKTVNHRGKWWAHLATSKKMTHCSNIALKKRVVVYNGAKNFLKSYLKSFYPIDFTKYFLWLQIKKSILFIGHQQPILNSECKIFLFMIFSIYFLWGKSIRLRPIETKNDNRIVWSI